MDTYPQIYNYARQPLGETSTEIKIHITILIRLKSNSISKPAMGMNYWRGRRGVWALAVIKSSHVLSTLGRMGLPGNGVTSGTFSPAYRYNDNHYTDNEFYDENENNNANDITGNKITVIMLILIDFDNNNINNDNDNSSNKNDGLILDG